MDLRGLGIRVSPTVAMLFFPTNFGWWWWWGGVLSVCWLLLAAGLRGWRCSLPVEENWAWDLCK